MSNVGENMDFFEAKKDEEGMISKILKGAMSVMFFVSIVTYSTGVKKGGKK